MFELIVIAISIFAFLVLIPSLRNKPKNHFLNLLPGPEPRYLGNAVQFLSDPTEIVPQFLQWISKHGPTFKWKDGPFSSIVITTDCKFIEHILSSSKLIDKPDQYNFFKLWLGSAMIVAPNHQHKFRRRLVTPVFNISNFEKLAEIFDSVSNCFVFVTKEYIGKERDIDIYPLSLLCALDVVCEASFGVKVNLLRNENSEYVQAVRTYLDAAVSKMMSPLHPKLHRFTASHYRQNEAAKILNSFADRIVQDKKTTTVREKHATLDTLLQVKEEGGDISWEYIRDEVNGLILGGFHTTSSALSFALYLLGLHPDVQEKVFIEQVDTFVDRDLRKAKATVKDLNSMRYLELVIKETLRLYPPVPAIGRQLPEDLEWDGVFYPKNTTILMVAMGIHRDPKYFEDPEKFIPERFQTNQPAPYTYLPFSSGPRNCIGQRFAMLEMKAILSKFLRNFEVLPSEPNHEPKLIFEVVLVSQNGVRIGLKHRKLAQNTGCQKTVK